MVESRKILDSPPSVVCKICLAGLHGYVTLTRIKYVDQAVCLDLKVYCLLLIHLTLILIILNLVLGIIYLLFAISQWWLRYGLT